MAKLVVETKLFRSTYDGIPKEDITEGFLGASVSADATREYTWEMNASCSWERWLSLTPYEDWLMPFLTVWYPDGTIRQGPLGLYLLLDSPESHTETRGTVELICQDPLWLVDRQGFHRNFHVQAGTRKTKAVKDILDSSVLTESSTGKRRYAIADSDKQFKKRYEWERDISKLDVCNEILEAIAFYPLWTTKRGIITSKRMGDNRLSQRHPVRFFTAHLPERYTLDARYRPLGGMPSDIVGTVKTTPKGTDLANEILIVNDTGRGSSIHVEGKITHPNNPRSVLQGKGRKKHSREIHNQVLEEDATVEEVALGLLDELSTRNEVIEFDAHPDPEPEFTRETIGLVINSAMGVDIAEGQYAVHRMDYRLSPDSAAMTVTAGRIDDARDYLGIDDTSLALGLL